MPIARTLSVLLCGVLAASGPVAAQDGDDWDFGQDPARDLTIAAVSFDNFGVAVRCMGDSLSVVVSGLPTDSGMRQVRYAMNEEPDRDSQWVSGQNSNAAFAVWPRSVAEELRHGGRLVLLTPEGQTWRRYQVDLPASGSAVGRVFQACGHTLETPAAEVPSGERFAGLKWRDMPEPNFPDRAQVAAGLAALSCTVRADGRLRACKVESEFPEGSGFGRAAVLGAHHDGRVEALDPSGPTLEGRTINFVTRYRLTNGLYIQPPPSRLPDRDDVYNPVRPAPDED